MFIMYHISKISCRVSLILNGNMISKTTKTIGRSATDISSHVNVYTPDITYTWDGARGTTLKFYCDAAIVVVGIIFFSLVIMSRYQPHHSIIKAIIFWHELWLPSQTLCERFVWWLLFKMSAICVSNTCVMCLCMVQCFSELLHWPLEF